MLVYQPLYLSAALFHSVKTCSTDQPRRYWWTKTTISENLRSKRNFEPKSCHTSTLDMYVTHLPPLFYCDFIHLSHSQCSSLLSEVTKAQLPCSFSPIWLVCLRVIMWAMSFGICPSVLGTKWAASHPLWLGQSRADRDLSHILDNQAAYNRKRVGHTHKHTHGHLHVCPSLYLQSQYQPCFISCAFTMGHICVSCKKCSINWP